MNQSNNRFWLIARVFVPIFLALGGVLYAYGRYTERVDTLQKTITKAENNERAIIGIEKDLEYLKDGMDKILRKLE